MSLTALILVFSSVLLHALWHFICKRQSPEFTFFIVSSLGVVLTMFPLLLFSGIIPWRLPLPVWLCLLGGGLCGMFGNIGLSYAYRYADISLAYPLARALPVLLTALLTTIFGFGKPLTLIVLAGMVIIFTGCIIMPFPSLRHFSFSAYTGKGMFGILLAAFATTGYTIFDSFGIHGLINFAPEANQICIAGAYSCIREFIDFSSLSVVSLIKANERKHFTIDIFLKSQPYCVGFFAGLAYVLILIAMEYVTNVSYIQAFRQLSLPVGLLLGILILKERATFQKIAGLALVLSGLLLVALN